MVFCIQFWSNLGWIWIFTRYAYFKMVIRTNESIQYHDSECIGDVISSIYNNQNRCIMNPKSRLFPHVSLYDLVFKQIEQKLWWRRACLFYILQIQCVKVENYVIKLNDTDWLGSDWWKRRLVAEMFAASPNQHRLQHHERLQWVVLSKTSLTLHHSPWPALVERDWTKNLRN